MKINTRKIEAAELEAMGLSEKALEVYSDSDFTVKYAAVTQDREAGNIIGWYDTKEEADKAIEEAEAQDKEEKTYTEDFYEEKDLFELYMNRDYCGNADDIDELSEMLEAYGE